MIPYWLRASTHGRSIESQPIGDILKSKRARNVCTPLVSTHNDLGGSLLNIFQHSHCCVCIRFRPNAIYNPNVRLVEQLKVHITRSAGSKLPLAHNQSRCLPAAAKQTRCSIKNPLSLTKSNSVPSFKFEESCVKIRPHLRAR